MSLTDLQMPIAAVPDGGDTVAVYGTFTGNISATWTPADGINIWLAANGDIPALYAPIAAAMRFVASGAALGSGTADSDTLLLRTWPTAYVALREVLGSFLPAEIRFGNVDATALHTIITTIFTALGRTSEAVDAFVAGTGLVRVSAGDRIGAAAAGTSPPAAVTPNLVTIRVFDAAGNEMNEIQTLDAIAEHASIDGTQHPLLANLPRDGWIDITVLGADDAPLGSEPYTLYFSDGTQRNGATDANGRLFESGVPAGDWAVDLTNQPSFSFID
jgi:hypothetical protein